jgi:hypothetical protein
MQSFRTSMLFRSANEIGAFHQATSCSAPTPPLGFGLRVPSLGTVARGGDTPLPDTCQLAFREPPKPSYPYAHNTVSVWSFSGQCATGLRNLPGEISGIPYLLR